MSAAQGVRAIPVDDVAAAIVLQRWELQYLSVLLGYRAAAARCATDATGSEHDRMLDRLCQVQAVERAMAEAIREATGNPHTAAYEGIDRMDVWLHTLILKFDRLGVWQPMPQITSLQAFDLLKARSA